MPARPRAAAREAKASKLRLSTKLDQKAAHALAAELRERRGSDLALDAGVTCHMGSLAVQVMLAAARSWAADGRDLKLVNVSDACVNQLSLLGFSPETVVRGADT